MRHLPLILAFAVLLYSPFVSAQTCTPVTVSKVFTSNDDGKGPNVTFKLTGDLFAIESFPASSTVTTAADKLQFGANAESGYVDVKAGFGGCQQSWGYEIVNWLKLTDTTTNSVIFQTGAQSTSTHNCGNAYSCAFASSNEQNGLPTGQFSMIAGHSYKFGDWMYGFIPNVGQSINYETDLIINDVAPDTFSHDPNGNLGGTWHVSFGSSLWNNNGTVFYGGTGYAFEYNSLAGALKQGCQEFVLGQVDNTTGNWAGLYWSQNATNSGYLANFNSNTLYLQKVVNGTDAMYGSIAHTFHAGDEVQECVWTNGTSVNVSAIVNGTTLLTGTDTSPYTSLYPGIWGYDSGSGTGWGFTQWGIVVASN
jgi:hypothetical protein